MKKILVVTPDGKVHTIKAETVIDTSMALNLKCIDKESGKLVITIGKNVVAVFKEWVYWVNLQYGECITPLI